MLPVTFVYIYVMFIKEALASELLSYQSCCSPPPNISAVRPPPLPPGVIPDLLCVSYSSMKTVHQAVTTGFINQQQQHETTSYSGKGSVAPVSNRLTNEGSIEKAVSQVRSLAQGSTVGYTPAGLHASESSTGPSVSHSTAGYKQSGVPSSNRQASSALTDMLSGDTGIDTSSTSVATVNHSLKMPLNILDSSGPTIGESASNIVIILSVMAVVFGIFVIVIAVMLIKQHYLRSRVNPSVSESTVSILGRQSNEASDIPLESRCQADSATITTDAAQH